MSVNDPSHPLLGLCADWRYKPSFDENLQVVQDLAHVCLNESCFVGDSLPSCNS